MGIFAWYTDLHLDFISEESIKLFCNSIKEKKVDGIFITGDISVGKKLESHLRTIDNIVDKQIYFVLGNHDAYDDSIASIRIKAEELCNASDNLHYLTLSDPISLTEKTAIVGHDGWYDAQYGQPLNSGVVMNDWARIHDFINIGAVRPGSGMYGHPPAVAMGPVIGLSRSLALKAANHIHRVAELAAKNHEVVIILTHFPPFPQSHRYNGRSGAPEYMPWYTSKVMGDAILDVAKNNPKVRFEIFCGHTHGKADDQIAQNVYCHVGQSEYEKPAIAMTIQLP